MKLNYKRELERAAKGMILIHRPETLIKLIARIIVQRVKVTHAGILLYDRKRKTYVFTVSKGKSGLKIPRGLVRLDPANPLVKFYTDPVHRYARDGALTTKRLDFLIRQKRTLDLKPALIKIRSQMKNLEADACIPTYYRDDLIGILVLGRKLSDREFKPEEVDFFEALSSDVAMAIHNAQLFEELQLRVEREHQLFVQTVMALAAAVDAKDHYTHGHTERVIDYSIKIAEKMNQKKISSLDHDFIDNLRIASLLHDVGKIGIPEAILNKQERLSDEEFAVIKRHPEFGVRILEPIKEMLKDAFEAVQYHHERYDGKGYPKGLKNEEIPVMAAIIGAADAFDAMTTDRPYRKAMSTQEAIEEVKRNLGTQFHPIIGACLIELYEEGKL